MPTVVTIRSDPAGELVKLEGRVNNPRPLLRKIGSLVEAASQLAFRRQALGDIQWPRRYPNQSPPFVNVAGVVADLNKSDSVKARRFEPRPVLQDRGILKQSAKAAEPKGDEVSVGLSGPAAEYGSLHHFGLVSTLPITDQAKKRLAKKMLPGGDLHPVRDKLVFLLQPNRTTLDTQLVERPLVGVPDDTARQIVAATEQHIAKGLSGGQS